MQWKQEKVAGMLGVSRVTVSRWENDLQLPSPLHMQTSGNARLPSILLAPLAPASPTRGGPLFAQDPNGPQVHLSIQLANDEPLDMDSWTEWLRMMPDGIKDVKVEGPYRHHYR